MIIKYKVNLTSGIFSLAFGFICFILIPSQIKISVIETGILNSQSLPKIVSILIMALGVFLILQSFLSGDTVREIHFGREVKATIYMLCLVVYALSFQYVGFLASTLFLGFITLVLLKSKKILYYVIVLLLTITLKIVFQYLLNIDLP